MQLLFPLMLAALATLAIPILIHLFYFRRFKTVYFTNVRFLKEVKEETASRSRLRNLLVLLMRCLALAMLVLAFCQPFIPLGKNVKKGDQSISIFIDNSFSMNALAKDLNLLEKAKQRARETVNAYAETDRFQILTNDMEGRHQRLVSKKDALTFIDEVKPSPTVQALSKVLMRQQQTLATGNTVEKVAFVISDFQKNFVDLANFKDTSLAVNLVPLAAVEQKNIAIDSAWFEAPVQMLNQRNALIVRVQNFSNEAVENVRLSLQYDGQSKPVGTLNLKANSSTIDTVPITVLKTGWHEAELTITDYPVQFDDHYFFTFQVPAAINVLTIQDGGNNANLNAALNSNRLFRVGNQTSNALDYSKLGQYQMIIVQNVGVLSSGLATELKQYIANGGNVLLFPATSIDAASYQSFFNTLQSNALNNYEPIPREVSGINSDEFVFNDVYTNKNANLKLPNTTANYPLSNRSGENLLTYRDGTSFLTKNKIGQGNFYLCAAPLDERVNNLSKSGEVFIPMLYKMAVSAAQAWNIAHIIGRDDFLEADSKEKVGETTFKLRRSGAVQPNETQEAFIPPTRSLGANKIMLSVRDGVRDAGFYNLFVREDSILSKFAFNFDRRESQLTYFDATALKSMAKGNINIVENNSEANLTAIVGERNQGIVLWRWCLILALAFLAIEVLLLRFWKV
jgi:Aerotolerance regulator N-terminal